MAGEEAERRVREADGMWQEMGVVPGGERGGLGSGGARARQVQKKRMMGVESRKRAGVFDVLASRRDRGAR